jgi:glutamine synthetase type III
MRQNEELGGEEVMGKSHQMRDNVIPAMNAVRGVVDRLEKCRPRRLLAAADVPRDAVHQVTAR